jgi:hypothetical protein
MLKIENFDVMGWEHAIRGMRNPKNSWDRTDSGYYPIGEHGCGVEIGDNDHKLMTSLAKGGPVHAKYRRMITVYLDITAPLYWWKEFDTYKVGTVANSCSTMHKIHAKEFDFSDFSVEHLLCDASGTQSQCEDCGMFTTINPAELMRLTIDTLNHYRGLYLLSNDKDYWWQMIQLLPTSYNQKRTVMLNYEVLTNIYESRRHHKLDEWHTFCDWIENLPYSELIIGEKDETDHN